MSFSFLIIVTAQQTFCGNSTRQFSGHRGLWRRPPHLPPIELVILLLHLVYLLLEPPDLLDHRHLDHLDLLCLLCVHVHCVSVSLLLNISLLSVSHSSRDLTLASSPHHTAHGHHIIMTRSLSNF